MRPGECPRCGSELDRLEVDIGVGTLLGPLHCPDCGWNPEEDPDCCFDEITEEF